LLESSSATSRRFVRPRQNQEISEWLEGWEFDRFITLASNDVMLADEKGTQTMRRKLRLWDARINRKVAGPKWRQRREDRIWSFFFLEKAHSNPHWHGLIQFFPPWPECAKAYADSFDEWAPIYWKRLVPSGTVDNQIIKNQKNVSDYVTKALNHRVSYENFVLPDEF
jgi:hypothetical protein